MSFLIVTKYFGPSDKLAARVEAVTEAHGVSERLCRAYLPYNHARAAEDAHRQAAKHLVDTLQARRGWRPGERAVEEAVAESLDGRGYTFTYKWVTR